MFRSLTTMDAGVVFFIIILINVWLQLWLVLVHIWFLKFWLPLPPGWLWGQTHVATRPLNNETSHLQEHKIVRPWDCWAYPLTMKPQSYESVRLKIMRKWDCGMTSCWDHKTSNLKLTKCPCEIARSWMWWDTKSLCLLRHLTYYFTKQLSKHKELIDSVALFGTS